MMSTEELDRPTEWLRRLQEERQLYRRLLSEAGNLAFAAYRLARARCRVQAVSAPIPTVAELRVSADEIARYSGIPRYHLGQLVADCQAAGLAVIVPLDADAA